MKSKILISLFLLISSWSYSQEIWLGETIYPDKWIEENDIGSIEKYCRQRLFATYGGYADGDVYIRPIDNETADKVIELLRHGASLKDPNCQFMLACVLSGNKAIRGYDDDYNEIVLPTLEDYKYLNDEEAQRYFKLYLNNPKMNKESGAFGYSIDQIMKLINNAYPNMQINNAKTRIELIEKAVSDSIENTAAKFGLG